MPDSLAKKSKISDKLRRHGFVKCTTCPMMAAYRQYGGDISFCRVNAGFRDVSPWVSRGEANQCPGPEIRELFLSAPAHYAGTPPNTS